MSWEGFLCSVLKIWRVLAMWAPNVLWWSRLRRRDGDRSPFARQIGERMGVHYGNAMFQGIGVRQMKIVHGH